MSGFLDSYRAAFERLDAVALADHYLCPIHLTADDGSARVLAVDTRADWVRVLEGLCEMYRAIDFGSARVLHYDFTSISPRLIQLRVRWLLRSAAGLPLYDFEASYTLAAAPAGWRISAVCHDEFTAYRACTDRVAAGRSMPQPNHTSDPSHSR